MIKEAILGAVFLVAAGCGQEEPAHPVSWYQEHQADRKARVAWCADDAARERHIDCENAAEAERRSLMGSQKDLAPIDWGASKPDPQR